VNRCEIEVAMNAIEPKPLGAAMQPDLLRVVATVNSMFRCSLLRKSADSADSEVKSCRLDFHQSLVRSIDVRDRDQHERDQER
jgi:hypothetical protein